MELRSAVHAPHHRRRPVGCDDERTRHHRDASEDAIIDAVHDWDFADAWVLAAIGVYQRPCTLGEVVAAAAWVDDTVPLEGEMESALGKLTGAGLVRVYEGWTFELTDEGASVWSVAARDLRGQLALIEAQLSAFEPGRGSVRLPAGEMRRAVEEHRAAP